MAFIREQEPAPEPANRAETLALLHAVALASVRAETGELDPSEAARFARSAGGWDAVHDLALEAGLHRAPTEPEQSPPSWPTRNALVLGAVRVQQHKPRRTP